jgi:hypothetical protein
VKLLIAGIATLVTWLISSIQPIPVTNGCQVTTFDGQGYGTYNECYTGR